MISPNDSMAQGKGNGQAYAKNAAPDDPLDRLNDDARSKWRETWPRLNHNCFDASRDRDVLAEYCEAWADIRQAESEIQRLTQIAKTTADAGDAGTSGRDLTKSRPFYEQRAAAMLRFDRVAEKLGLSLNVPQSPPWSHYAYVFEPFPEELAEQDEKEVESTAPGRYRRIWTCRRVWGALQRSFGNMSAAARLLSETYGVICKRSAISFLAKKFPRLREAIGNCEQTLLELCYSALMQSAIGGDGASQRFVLRKCHPDYKDPPPDLPRKKSQSSR
jgi:P27 family predicted phage terminase small subunit